jgi:uncharacterized protein
MFDENKIKSDLIDLSVKKNLVFAASCCERLIPFYFAFSKVENWGNPALLESALDKIWEIAKTEQFSNKEIANLSQYCASSAPDSEDFTSPYTSQAQDACAAICYTLDFCYTKDISFLGYTARVSFEAVESYLNIANDPILEVHAADSQFDEWIQTAPLLLAEIKYQQEDLKLLSENEIDNTLIEKIRYRSSKSGVQPEKRGLL